MRLPHTFAVDLLGLRVDGRSPPRRVRLRSSVLFEARCRSLSRPPPLLPLVLRNHPEGVEDDGSTVLVATLSNDFEGFAAVRLGFGEPSLLLRNHGETLMRACLRQTVANRLTERERFFEVRDGVIQSSLCDRRSGCEVV